MTNVRYFADDEFVPVGIAAEIAYLSVSVMNKLRWNGGGPAYFKIGRSVRYRVGDVRVWLESKRVTSVADYKQEGAAA